jgi:formate dehydrogenase major subunit
MEFTRRSFLRFSGVTAGSVLLPAGFSAARENIPAFPLHKPVKESVTICPYCSCGCGLLIATGTDGHIVNCEGDPDNPQNRGALDPKSISVRQLSQSDLRLKRPLYRAPGSSSFEEKSWDWMIDEISKRIKTTRDATFQSYTGCHDVLYSGRA